MKRELKNTVRDSFVGLSSLALSLLYVIIFNVGLLQASVPVPDDSVFDIIGSIDMVLPLGLEGPDRKTEKGENKRTVLVVDGDYYEVSREAVIEHFMLPEASIENIQSGDTVGFTLTAGGHVMELWVLDGGDEKRKRSQHQEERRPSFEQTYEPPPAFDIKKNEDGVWVN